jgi:hypothetical protein
MPHSTNADFLENNDPWVLADHGTADEIAEFLRREGSTDLTTDILSRMLILPANLPQTQRKSNS